MQVPASLQWAWRKLGPENFKSLQNSTTVPAAHRLESAVEAQARDSGFLAPGTPQSPHQK